MNSLKIRLEKGLVLKFCEHWALKWGFLSWTEYVSLVSFSEYLMCRINITKKMKWLLLFTFHSY